MDNEIGERIRAIRISKGMTQKEVAERCGMADSAIRKYESGRQVPKIKTIEGIAAALEVPASALLGFGTDQNITMSDEALREFGDGFSKALNTVMLLPNEEKQLFYDFIEQVNVMLQYSNCIGKVSDLMGQSIAIDRFLFAAISLNIINSKFIKQAYDKFYAINPKKKPRIQVSFSAVSPDDRQKDKTSTEGE